MKNEKPKKKKKWYQKKWVWILIVFLVLYSFGSRDDDTTNAGNKADSTVPTSSPVQNVQSTNEPEETADVEPLTFDLIAGEAGEYGELFTINKDTEFEETYYIYRIPTGTYTVTNIGEYMNQFNVYGETVYVTEYGWEELSDVYYVKALDVGESDTFTFEDGQIIEIHEPGKFTLVKTD